MTRRPTGRLAAAHAVVVAVAVGSLLTGCSSGGSDAASPTTTATKTSTARLEKLAGRYAHYDVVAYQSTDMKNLIISYGFTDLFVKDGKLWAKESFCHADNVNDQPIDTTISDAATSAIRPIATPVTVSTKDGRIRIQRPETPTGIGIRLEDPANDVLPTDPKDPRISDDDKDGKPGITVRIKVTDELQGDLYIARRERFAYDVSLQDDRSLSGTVTDKSEQLIVGATNDMFITRAEWKQVPDLSKSPILLKPVRGTWDCTRLMASRDQLFPKAPVVDW